MENEIMLVNERYHMLEEVSDDIVLDYDVKKQQFEIPECYRKFAADKSVKYAGIEELYGAIHPDDLEKFKKMFETALQREIKGTAEYRLRQGTRDSKKYSYFRTCYQSIADYDGKISHIIGRSYDISTERAVREKLLREVQLDPLTRIYNKTASEEIADAFLEKSTQGTHVLYVIDIDDFKKINDTFGHTVGDMVISDIATLIRKQFTDEAVVGRVGGDEFMVFVKDTSVQEAETKAEQLCTNVQKTLSGDGAVLVVTLSVGMAVTGKDGYDYSTLFEVEVTESVMTEKLEDLTHCMIELTQMGFRIAIDDFGTGYSSLSVLYEIPANVVKIDKSFTDKVMVDNKGEFVSQMGKFIRAAKEEIVVEGIEMEEQRQFLESYGFEYGQGYLFDRPIPADEFERKYL